MCILVLRKLSSYFLGAIDAESYNENKKWMLPPRGEAIKTEKLNKMLRTHHNTLVHLMVSNTLDGHVRLEKNGKMKDTNHEGHKLDILSGKLMEIVSD